MTKTSKLSAMSAKKRGARTTERKSAKRPQVKRVPATISSPANTQAASVAAPIRQTKKGAILALLERPDGAGITELTTATGWQAHSVRAVLTGFRKDGKELIRAKDDAGLTRYRLSASA